MSLRRHSNESRRTSRSSALDGGLVSFLLVVCLLGLSCCRALSPPLADAKTVPHLTDEQLVLLEHRLDVLRMSLADMAGDQLMLEFDDDSSSDRDVPAIVFSACKSYLIEHELVRRGHESKDCYVKHLQDPRFIFTGFSTPFGVVSELCEYHLAQMKLTQEEGGSSGEMYLSFIVYDPLMKEMIDRVLSKEK